MELRGFANLESVRRFAAFLPPAADILVAVATICLPLRGISRGAAPYLYTQSVCAACFASILRRLSRRLGVPGREHFPAFEKAGQNTDSTPGVLFYGCPAFCGSCRTA